MNYSDIILTPESGPDDPELDAFLYFLQIKMRRIKKHTDEKPTTVPMMAPKDDDDSSVVEV